MPATAITMTGTGLLRAADSDRPAASDPSRTSSATTLVRGPRALVIDSSARRKTTGTMVLPASPADHFQRSRLGSDFHPAVLLRNVPRDFDRVAQMRHQLP